MHAFRRSLLSTAVGASALIAVGGQPARAGDAGFNPALGSTYRHVLLISVDGMHAIDLTNWIENHPTAISPSSPATASSTRTPSPPRRRTAIRACWRRSPAPRQRRPACSTTTAMTARISVQGLLHQPGPARCRLHRQSGHRSHQFRGAGQKLQFLDRRWSPTTPAAERLVRFIPSSIRTTCSATSWTANACRCIRTNMCAPTRSSKSSRRPATARPGPTSTRPTRI